MKWVGALLVVIAAVYLGRHLGRPYRRRCAVLMTWERCAGFLIPLIVWHQMPLPQALSRAAEAYPTLSLMLDRVVAKLDERDADVVTAFRHGLASEPSLKPTDGEVLEDFASKLGSSSAQFQQDLLQSTELRLHQLAEESRVMDLKQARLLETLVSLSGVALVILLL